ncbi:MAG TPA: hypothetical protein VFA67_11765 [Candidatus Sulfotelmatobacter sp.]|nr:hypothetical protein [Candidatus Sulfotelmatobacter sp.]
MNFKHWAVALVLTTTPFLAQACPVGADCQPGTITGPFTASQAAEFSTTAPFAICQSIACTTGIWSGNQIEGIDAQQNIGTSAQFYDNNGPNIDDNIAVGPTVSGQNGQVLEWVNAAYIQAFDKVTGQPIFTTGGTTAVPVSVGILWSPVSQPECQRNPAGNVQVIFDRVDNVFVISRRVVYTDGYGIHRSAWCIAASSGSDLSSPAIQWYAYEYKLSSVIPCLPSSNNCTTGAYYYYFPDWPRIGTWSDGFYITFDLQDPTAGYVESGFEACQLDRAAIVQGRPSLPITCYAYLVPSTQRPSLIHSVDVADIDSSLPPPAGEPEYFLAIVNPSNSQQGFSGLRYCTSQTTPCISNYLASFTWGANGFAGPKFVRVNSYTPGCYNTSAANRESNTFCVPEPSTNPLTIGAYGSPTCGNYSTPCLDSLGDRMANRLTYNNLNSSPGNEYLTASHVVMESASNQRTGIRYYVLKVAAGTASVSINSGTAAFPDLQDPNGNLFYFMPSAALDSNGNLGITYTTSGPFCGTCQAQSHPAVYFDVLPRGAASFDAPTLIVQGTADEQNTGRYGEYAATVIDPSDNLTFYGVGEYFNTSESGTSNCSQPAANCFTWQTRIFRGQYGLDF